MIYWELSDGRTRVRKVDRKKTSEDIGEFKLCTGCGSCVGRYARGALQIDRSVKFYEYLATGKPVVRTSARSKPKRYFVLNGTISKWWIPKRVSRYLRRQEDENEIMNLIHPSENEEILDAGAGYGRFTISLAKRGAQVTSVDLSTEMLKMCDKQAKREQVVDKVTLVEGDIERLPFNDYRFDKSVCIATLEHVPDHEKAIKELIRVTHARGSIVVETTSLLHPTILRAWLKHRLVNRYYEGTCKEIIPYYPRTPWQILKAFKKHGAKVKNHYGFYTFLPAYLAKQTNTFSFGLKDFPVLKFFGGVLVVKAIKSI